MAPALPPPGGRARPCRRNNSTMAAAFSPRTFRKNRARFNSFTSSAVYSRYLLSVRRGRVSPRFSQARITDDETPTRFATSPIFKYFLGLDDFMLHRADIQVFYSKKRFFYP
jgi:hypothetical protein